MLEYIRIKENKYDLFRHKRSNGGIIMKEPKSQEEKKAIYLHYIETADKLEKRANYNLN